MSVVLVSMVVLPVLGAVAQLHPDPVLSGRTSTIVAAACFLGATALTVHTASQGLISAAISNSHGHLIAGFYVNRIIGVLLMLVCGVSAVVQGFAVGYLRGDVRAARMFAWASLLTGSTVAMVSAATIIGLGIAWTLAGIFLCGLLNTYSGLPAACQGVRRTAAAFAIGDSALWAAIVLATVHWGDLDLRDLSAQAPALAHHTELVSVFACLVLLAALARSAQLPLQRWLPATLAAPTPVSALLHAGVINAGGVLLVRLGPLWGTSGLASALAFAFGGATMLYGTALMLVKPDVKGALAHSTMGQMGFMIMTCGLGAFAAAVFHLVAHGMYKATLFLNSGAAVHRHVRHTKAPPPRLRTGCAQVLGALAFASGAVVSAGLAAHPQIGGRDGSSVLLIFAGGTVSATTWGILRRGLPRRVLLPALVAVLAGVWAYVGWLRVFAGFVRVDLISIGQRPVSPWLLALLVPALLAITLVRVLGERSPASQVHRRIYVWALTAGHVHPAQEAALTRAKRASAALATLEPGPEGAC